MDNQPADDPFNHRRGSFLAQVAAVKTQARVEQEILFPGAAFRILAPSAAELASFHEDNGADARTIVGGIALNVENHR